MPPAGHWSQSTTFAHDPVGHLGAELGRARELVMLVGVETCGLKVKDLAAAVGRNPGSASRLHGQAVAQRREDPGFRALVQRVIEASRRSASPRRLERTECDSWYLKERRPWRSLPMPWRSLGGS